MCDNNYYILNDNSTEVQESSDADTNKIRDIIETTGDIAEAAKVLLEEYKNNYDKDDDDD